MFENIENLKIISVIHGKSSLSRKNDGRKNHSFIIRVKGCMQYFFDNKCITVHEGEMIFIPKGSVYEYKKMCDDDTFYTIINMEGDFGNVKPCRYSLSDFCDANYIMNHLADLWKMGGASNKHKCMSILYSLISYVSNIDAQKYEDKTKFVIIEPAENYLKEHIYDYDLQISELHRLCGVSDTYFRRIFISKHGTSPKEYVISKRVSYAKSVIDSGEFTSVRELALSVGYKDPLYFGKVFKRHFGMSPSFADK